MTMPVLARTSAATAVFLALFLAPAVAQDPISGSTLDGATFQLPSVWVIGEPLAIAGENWTTHAGDRGSVIGVKYDFGEVVPTDPVDEMDDIWARITADGSGAFSAELPYPADAGWSVGEEHTIHLLTGAMGDNDKVRNPTLRVTLVAAD